MDEEIPDAESRNYISCLAWVKQGVAAKVPDKIELSAKELQAIIQDAQSELQELKAEDDSDEDADTEGGKDKKKKKKTEDEEMDDDGSINAADEFNFDNYDEESGDIYCNMDRLAILEDGKDPNITVADEDDNDSEKEDDIIKPHDNLLLVGHIVDEASILEVYIYNEEESSFYCHHHDYLSYIPLCFEWLDFDPGEQKPGNLCAIGNDTPIIEVWDLDVVGAVGPVFKLGKKPNKKKKIKRIGHKDAVLDLAWNQTHHHILASGSADRTVLLWDLENGTPSSKFSPFEGVVQSIKWHPTKAHLLLTGGMDKKVRLFDGKTEQAKVWQASGEVEKVVWNHYDPNTCFISTDNGFIECIDIRQDNPLWQKQVQEEEIAGLSMSASCQGLLISSNKNGAIKVWDVKNHLEPQLVFEKQSNLGQIICLEASCNSPYIFAVGGDNKAHNLNVLDFSTINEVAEKFKDRAPITSRVNSALRTQREHNESMMDVTQDLGSIALGSLNSKKLIKKKKKPRHRDLYKK
ncbi:periodic tryptophan protein 1 homolog isoform X2 [Copidosoma floridanum]|uniref:periodic tryptophan protein 1 homolog isoform X2 n=1 Tax=Copidosoma floridanum TaxID=29053 RepID=UPI0006C99C6C|nr:periodic tryptophan protein 1 homolog isoform X2 [Copidosoma floridanum]